MNTIYKIQTTDVIFVATTPCALFSNKIAYTCSRWPRSSIRICTARTNSHSFIRPIHDDIFRFNCSLAIATHHQHTEHLFSFHILLLYLSTISHWIPGATVQFQFLYLLSLAIWLPMLVFICLSRGSWHCLRNTVLDGGCLLEIDSRWLSIAS